MHLNPDTWSRVILFKLQTDLKSTLIANSLNIYGHLGGKPLARCKLSGGLYISGHGIVYIGQDPRDSKHDIYCIQFISSYIAELGVSAWAYLLVALLSSAAISSHESRMFFRKIADAHRILILACLEGKVMWGNL